MKPWEVGLRIGRGLRSGLQPLFWVIASGAVYLIASGAVMVDLRFDWRHASRESAGIAPAPARERAALVQLYVARVFSLRGLFGVHPWAALKPEGADHYTVIQALGWNLRHGLPLVSIKPDLPDRRWYGSPPQLLFELRGERATTAIPKILAAVRAYPYADQYTLWPGPNSNTLMAHLIRTVPELAPAELPPTAIGKDYFPGFTLTTPPSGHGVQLAAGGWAGIILSPQEGVEVNLLGLVAGIDWQPWAIKLPVWGRIGR